jgi:hypothetical protein
VVLGGLDRGEETLGAGAGAEVGQDEAVVHGRPMLATGCD